MAPPTCCLYDGAMNASLHPPARAPRSGAQPFGEHLRHWRQHRRLSQLDLASEADISTRHLSFVETGRSVPSREMVLRLSERLDIPLRERNTLLVAAGYAPMYRERALSDPALASARQAVELILKSHEPWPARPLLPFRLSPWACWPNCNGLACASWRHNRPGDPGCRQRGPAGTFLYAVHLAARPVGLHGFLP